MILFLDAVSSGLTLTKSVLRLILNLHHLQLSHSVKLLAVLGVWRVCLYSWVNLIQVTVAHRLISLLSRLSL